MPYTMRRCGGLEPNSAEDKTATEDGGEHPGTSPSLTVTHLTKSYDGGA